MRDSTILTSGIPISESIVVTWIIMAVLVLLSVILVRNLRVENPGKKQLALESIITTFNNLFSDVLGEKGKAYIPYLITVILYIGNGKYRRYIWI